MSMQKYEIIFIVLAFLFVISVIMCVFWFIKFKNTQIRLENEINNAKENINERVEIIENLKKNLQVLEEKNDDLQKNLAISQTNCINLDNKIKENLSFYENLQTEISTLRENITKINRDNSALSITLETKENEINELKLNNQKDKENLELNFKDQLQNMKKMFEEGIKSNFENIKNVNIKELSEDSKKKFDEIIKPLENNIKEYREKMIQTDASFKAVFENFQNQALKLGVQADELVNTLKGDKKMQGNLGELQLEKILNASGLVKGINYHTQVGYKDSAGKQKYLDMVVDLDNNKKAIIDSKFSLINYNNYCNSNDDEEKVKYAAELAKNLESHIKNLDSKEYKDYDVKTYPYIFMFIPYDDILRVALSQNQNLYTYAYEKGIFLTTPLTLLMALKTVYICWLNLQSDKNAEMILKLSGQIYDKFVIICEKFNTLSLRLESLQNSKDDVYKTLTGRGGMAGFVEKLKQQGAKTTKNLPKDIAEDAEIIDSLDFENQTKLIGS